MKTIIKNLSVVFTLLLATSSYGQPGDLTHPVRKNKPRNVSYSIFSLPEGINPLVIYDGITFFNSSSLKKLDPNTINSVKKSRDSVVDQNNQLKFNAIIEITTLEGINSGLKHLKEETTYWIRQHPLAVFCLDGKVLWEDQEKLNELVALKIDDIKEVRTLNSQQGEELLGKLGENGVIVISTQ